MKTINELYPYKTATELKMEYPNQWILLINANYDNDHELLGGFFVAKSKEHSKVCAKGGKITNTDFVVSTWFAGKIELHENTIVAPFCVAIPDGFLNDNKSKNLLNY